MVTSFKLDTWYRFKSENHRNKFLNANPSYGRFASNVGMERFCFTEFLTTTRHFKLRDVTVDVLVVSSDFNELSRDDRICAVHEDMLKYIEVV